MSIVGVIGLPGSGKTTLLAKAAYKWLHGKSFLGMPARSKVLTNFDCPGCYKLSFDCLGLYNFQDMNIIIDEIMLLADNRNFKSFPEHLKAIMEKVLLNIAEKKREAWKNDHDASCFYT